MVFDGRSTKNEETSCSIDSSIIKELLKNKAENDSTKNDDIFPKSFLSCLTSFFHSTSRIFTNFFCMLLLIYFSVFVYLVWKNIFDLFLDVVSRVELLDRVRVLVLKNENEPFYDSNSSL
jgi:hypothetical protein